MHLQQEFRQAARALARQPGLALLSIAALAIGIGLPTAMFSLVQAALLRGLPFEDANRIYHLERRRIGERGEGAGAHARDIVEWRSRQRSFEQIAAYNSSAVILRSGSGAQRHPAAYVTPNMFALLRVQAAHGRALAQDDDRAGGTPVVVLGHDVWRDRFASNPAIVGTTVFIDGNAHTVLGVMPERFRFPDESQIWLPLRVDARAAAEPARQSFDVIGRLRAGVSGEEARAEFAVIARQVAAQYPQYNRDIEVTVKRLSERLFGEVATQTMYVMLGAVLLVLLVACINVANLLLVRAVHRVREFAIRAAIGAGRARIVRQMFMEALILSVAGGGLGVVVAMGANAALAQGAAGRLPSWVDIRIDPVVLTFALLLTAVSAVVAAVLPAYKSTRGDLATTLYDASRGSTGLKVGRVMRALISAEIAFSFALVVLTALMVRGVGNVRGMPTVFAAENVFTAQVTLPDRYDATARLQYFESLQRELAAANASVVALGSTVPADRAALANFTQEGETYATDARPITRVLSVTPEFFPLFETRALSGRLFGPEDRADSEPVAIVNARFVERFLANKDPLGQRIRFGADEPWRRIVGVIPNLWVGGLDAPVTDRNPAGVYLPVAQNAPQSLMVIARARNERPLDLSEPVRAAAFRLDPDVPVDRVRTMTQVIEDSSWFYGWGASIMAICGLSALLLATIGLFGVVAFSVGRRVREFGIRLAVGATPGNVIRLVLGQSAAQIILGLTLGLALALLLGRGVSSLMFLVKPNDPLVIGTVALLLTGIALFAAYTPARRAAHIDPLKALRED